MFIQKSQIIPLAVPGVDAGQDEWTRWRCMRKRGSSVEHVHVTGYGQFAMGRAMMKFGHIGLNDPLGFGIEPRSELRLADADGWVFNSDPEVYSSRRWYISTSEGLDMVWRYNGHNHFGDDMADVFMRSSMYLNTLLRFRIKSSDLFNMFAPVTWEGSDITTPMPFIPEAIADHPRRLIHWDWPFNAVADELDSVASIVTYDM